MLEFKIIEGMFCSGKSSMLTDVAQVLDLREFDVLREPTTPFCPSSTHSETQRALFDTYVAAWTRESDVYEAAGGAAVLGDKTIWTDFSPLGCVPFTRALAAVEEDAVERGRLEELADGMVAVLNRICRRWRVTLHRYLPSPTVAEVLRRLRRRDRRGDEAIYDQPPEELWWMALVGAQYNFFFDTLVDVTSQGRVRGVR